MRATMDHEIEHGTVTEVEDFQIARYTGKSKLVISKLVRDKMSDGIESRETAEMKREYMCGLQNFLADKPPNKSASNQQKS